MKLEEHLEACRQLTSPIKRGGNLVPFSTIGTRIMVTKAIAQPDFNPEWLELMVYEKTLDTEFVETLIDAALKAHNATGVKQAAVSHDAMVGFILNVLQNARADNHFIVLNNYDPEIVIAVCDLMAKGIIGSREQKQIRNNPRMDKTKLIQDVFNRLEIPPSLAVEFEALRNRFLLLNHA